jgi:hypothetical protein
MVEKVAEHFRSMGYQVEIPAQGGREEQPDLIAKGFDETIAIEIEVSADHPDQVKKNYEKNLWANRVIFIAPRRFGRWIHSMSYENCLKLRGEVERYLENRSISAGLILNAIRMFCGAMDVEVGYDEQVYGLLKEALEHAAKTSEEEAVRSHVRALMEIIATAERLKSNIMCSG